MRSNATDVNNISPKSSKGSKKSVKVTPPKSTEKTVGDNSAARRSTNRSLAIRLAEAGIPVFPSLNKVPKTYEWTRLDTAIGADGIEEIRAREIAKAANSDTPYDRDPDSIQVGCTTNPTQARKWWDRWPDAVPSISLGPAGLYVLDADINEQLNGPKLIREWAATREIDLSKCPITKTQSGGEHIFFHGPELRSQIPAEMAACYVQIKGIGNQVVAPGAWREDDKKYHPLPGHPGLLSAFSLKSLPPVPQPLLDLQSQKSTNTQSVGELAPQIDALKAAVEIDYDFLCEYVYDFDRLRKKDKEFEKVLTQAAPDNASVDRWTLGKCLHREYGAAFTIEHFKSILENTISAGTFVGDEVPGDDAFNWRNIIRDYHRSKGSDKIMDGSQFGAVSEELDPSDYVPAHLDGAVGKIMDDALAGAAKKKKRRLAYELFDAAADAALDQAGDPLIDGMLDASEFSVFFGQSNAGKTFVALDWAFHVAAGLPWQGHEVTQGLVVYVAAEGSSKIRLRLAALRTHYRINGAVHLALVRSSVDLRSSDADRKEIIRLVRDAVTESGGMKCVWIVVDTLARALGGGDENSGVDMGQLVQSADAIREATGAHFTYIHHSGKDAAKKSRGHSSLRGAIDSEFEVFPNRIENSKQRNMDAHADVSFLLKNVPLGTDSKGRPTSSAVCVFGEAVASAAVRPKASRKGKLSPTQAAVLGSFQAVAARRVSNGAADPDVVLVKEAKDELNAGRETPMLDTTFDAAKSKLITAGHLKNAERGAVRLVRSATNYAVADEDEEE